MTKIGYPQHEEVLEELIKELEADGYKVIDLESKSPDAIAVRCNNNEIEIAAVEVLGRTYRKGQGWHSTWTHRSKRKTYSMFDKVIIRCFRRNKEYQKGGPSITGAEEG